MEPETPSKIDWTARKAEKKQRRAERVARRQAKARQVLHLNIPSPTATDLMEAEARRKAQRVASLDKRHIIDKKYLKNKSFYEKKHFSRKGVR